MFCIQSPNRGQAAWGGGGVQVPSADARDVGRAEFNL